MLQKSLPTVLHVMTLPEDLAGKTFLYINILIDQMSMPVLFFTTFILYSPVSVFKIVAVLINSIDGRHNNRNLNQVLIRRRSRSKSDKSEEPVNDLLVSVESNWLANYACGIYLVLYWNTSFNVLVVALECGRYQKSVSVRINLDCIKPGCAFPPQFIPRTRHRPIKPTYFALKVNFVLHKDVEHKTQLFSRTSLSV